MSRVRGGSQLRKQLRRMPNEITDEIKKAIAWGAEEIRAEIELRAPRDEGDLAENVRAKISSDKLGAAIGYSKSRPGFKNAWKKAFTALFQEFGTRHHAAQPFIAPSFRSKLRPILDRIDGAIDAALKRVINS